MSSIAPTDSAKQISQICVRLFESRHHDGVVPYSTIIATPGVQGKHVNRIYDISTCSFRTRSPLFLPSSLRLSLFPRRSSFSISLSSSVREPYRSMRRASYLQRRYLQPIALQLRLGRIANARFSVTKYSSMSASQLAKTMTDFQTRCRWQRIS